jgi:hypothetical protein
MRKEKFGPVDKQELVVGNPIARLSTQNSHLHIPLVLYLAHYDFKLTKN